jgi:MoaA/NifB/PqqE/SkfB family radical SAM enzyme
MRNPFIIIDDLRKFEKVGIPKTVFWAVINYCNAVCITCNFYKVPKKIWKYVTFENAKRAVDIMYASNFRMISLTGGEPLMNPDICDICDYINKKGMIITYIPTNGLLVNDYLATRLKGANVRLMGISIDLPGNESQSDMGLTRKIPNLRNIIINARKCLENAGIKTYAGILLTKQTLDIPKVLNYVNTLGFDKVIFSYPQTNQSSSFQAFAESNNLILSLDEIRNVVTEIKSAKRSFKIGIHNPDVSLDEFLKYSQDIPRRYKCRGGSQLFYLDWNLDLYRCFTLPKQYGNILEMGKIDIKEDTCDLCSQQAFRDQDAFYHLANSLELGKKYLIKGNIPKAAKTVFDKNNKDAVSAVYELLRGKFI